MAAGEEIGVYGQPAPGLAPPMAGALQFSPLVPGAAALEDAPDASLARMVIAAPPGTIERRSVLAHALRALRPGGELMALAPKKRGGTRLADELRAFGCEPSDVARRHHRICACDRPSLVVGIDAAIDAAAPQVPPLLGLWSQPGVFSWDRLDPGAALLNASTPRFAGRGADLGCGVGVLALESLKSEAVTAIALVDIDRRAVEAARRNVADPRASFVHADARALQDDLAGLDFVIMNPPFHSEGREDRALGARFVAIAAGVLRKGGVCRLVANVALPYEVALARSFSSMREVARGGGFKVLEGVR